MSGSEETVKRVWFGALWLVGFVGVGYAAGLRMPRYLGLDHVSWWLAGLGAVVFLVAMALRLLPGVRPRPEVAWGFVQAFWLTFWFLGMQVVGAGVFAAMMDVAAAVATALHRVPANAGEAGVIAGAVCGYLAATLWALWYVGRLGPKRLHDGAPAGIGWRPAARQGYVTAALFAAVIILLVIGLVHVFPPDLDRIKAMPSAKLFAQPGWPALVLLVLAVGVAPVVEEFVFRGGVFAALASRLSPLWAGVVTTLLFMAVHAPEKYAYPPGFIDVGLMAAGAAWLRVKYGSIRPGMLLHLLYNAGLILAAGLVGGGR